MYEFENKSKILSGEKALESIPFELVSRKVNNPLIITEEVVERVGFLKELRKAFNYGNITARSIYASVPEIATADIIQKLYNKYIKDECDSIIALGRNSVINVAKALKYMINNDVDNIAELPNKKNEERIDKTVLFILPVYLGTGDEAATKVKFYDVEKNITYQIKSVLAQSDAIFIDKRMIDNLPKNLIVNLALYTISIAITSYLSENANCLTKTYSLTALKLVLEGLPKILSRKKSKKSDVIPLIEAIVYAGIAKSETKITVLDVISNAISNNKKIPFEKVYETLFYNLLDKIIVPEANVDELLIPFVGYDVLVSTLDSSRPTLLISTIESYIKNIFKQGKIFNLEALGVERSDFSNIAEKTKFDVEATKLNKELEIQEIYQILEKSFK